MRACFSIAGWLLLIGLFALVIASPPMRHRHTPFQTPNPVVNYLQQVLDGRRQDVLPPPANPVQAAGQALLDPSVSSVLAVRARNDAALTLLTGVKNDASVGYNAQQTGLQGAQCDLSWSGTCCHATRATSNRTGNYLWYFFRPNPELNGQGHCKVSFPEDPGVITTVFNADQCGIPYLCFKWRYFWFFVHYWQSAGASSSVEIDISGNLAGITLRIIGGVPDLEVEPDQPIKERSGLMQDNRSFPYNFTDIRNFAGGTGLQYSVSTQHETWAYQNCRTVGTIFVGQPSFSLNDTGGVGEPPCGENFILPNP